MLEESQTEDAVAQSSATALAPPLSQDTALAQLAEHDLSSAAVEQISKDSALMKSRKIRVAIVSHPHTPRRIALKLIRELYTFDLMHFAVLPNAPADLRHVADELLISRLASITLGERISLARRCSAAVAGALLLDKETRVWQSALESPRLTEASVIKALQRTVTAAFVESLSHHAKWSVRPEIRIALLRNAHTPLARAIEFARRLPPAQLRDVLHGSRLPEKIKAYLWKDLESRQSFRGQR
ncbi:MAG TPA: hypothetical protein VGS05_08195 [Candidatus Sulfotelmatobacter sp.]|nr:hypothetical protein [Candidatus Sulfotelmatobacter sp.]